MNSAHERKVIAAGSGCMVALYAERWLAVNEAD